MPNTLKKIKVGKHHIDIEHETKTKTKKKYIFNHSFEFFL